MSNSTLPSFVWKLVGISAVQLRDCKYLKNDKWQKHKIFQNPVKQKKIESCKVLVFVAFSVFELLMIFQAADKNDPLPSNQD